MQLGARLAIAPADISVAGIDHVPRAGPVVLAVRHYHHLLDGLGLLAHTGRPLHVMIGLDWVRTPTTRWLMEGLARACAWPVTLRTDAGTVLAAYAVDEIRPYQQRAYRQCVDLLGRQRVVVIFPESYPVIDPHVVRRPRRELLAPFKAGFARAAVAAARRHGRPVNVVPVGIRADADNAARMGFRYGEPRLVTAATDVDGLVAAVRADICQLSGDSPWRTHRP
jgi:putative membrane protein